MFRFFTFIIFLGLLVFTNISKSYSNFFMPQNARSDTTSVGKSIPARRIAPVNRTNSINKVTPVGRTTPVNKTQNIAKPKNKFINQKKIMKQKPARKLFMALKNEEKKNVDVNNKKSQEKISADISNKEQKEKGFEPKDKTQNAELNVLQEENISKDNININIVENKTRNAPNIQKSVFDEINAEYQADLKKISKGTYRGNPRINKVLSDFQNKEHSI